MDAAGGLGVDAATRYALAASFTDEYPDFAPIAVAMPDDLMWGIRSR